MYRDQPHQLVQEVLNEALWPDHPLGRNLAGTEATLDFLTRPRLVEYQRRNYVANRTLIVAAGRLKHRSVVRSVARLARRFPVATVSPFVPVTERQQAPVVRLRTKETEQTQLALAIRVCSRHDERRYALRLLNILLGENMSSRLFQVIREDLGIAYSIYSSLGFFDDTGTLTVSAGLDLKHLNKTLELIRAELRRLTRQGHIGRAAPAHGQLRRHVDPDGERRLQHRAGKAFAKMGVHSARNPRPAQRIRRR